MTHCSSKLLIVFLLFILVLIMSECLFAEEYVYQGKGKRDPFISLMDSGVRIGLGLEVVETVEDVKFEGVIFDPFGKSMAMLNGQVVKEGDAVYNVEVVKIYSDAITVKIYDKAYTLKLELEEEGGETIER